LDHSALEFTGRVTFLSTKMNYIPYFIYSTWSYKSVFWKKFYHRKRSIQNYIRYTDLIKVSKYFMENFPVCLYFTKLNWRQNVTV